MRDVFLTVLNMSLTGSLVILAVLLLRLALRKAPKVFSYALWAVVLFRLLCPVTLESPLGLLPADRTQSAGIGSQSVILPQTHAPTITAPANDPSAGQSSQTTPAQSGIQTVTPNVTAPAKRASIDWVLVGSIVWLTGVFVMLAWSVIALLRLRRRLAEAVPLAGERDVWLADHIPSPFVLGLFRPKIYLPGRMSGAERDYVLLHERTHIRRLDPVFRALAWLALALHWFDPLVWLAFHLAGKDMEMSCDEAVLRRMGRDIRSDYSASLLRLSVGKRLSVGPLAFGDGDPKSRIKNVLNYKKPAFWVILAALVAVLAAGAALATDRAADKPSDDAAVYTLVEEESSLGTPLYSVRIDAPEGDFVWRAPYMAASFILTAEGYLDFEPTTALHPWFKEYDGVYYGTAYWSEWLSRDSITVDFVTALSSVEPLPSFTVDLTNGVLTLSGGTDSPFTDEEMLSMARRLAELIRGAEGYYIIQTGGYVPGLNETPWLPEDAVYSLDSLGRVEIQGLDSGRTPLWVPPGGGATFSELGWFSADAPFFLNSYFETHPHMLSAYWTDESKTTIQVNFFSASSDLNVLAALPQNFSVYLPTGAVEVTGWSGSYLDTDGPHPYEFTGEEMQYMGGVLAALIQGAEEYYAYQTSGAIPPGPAELWWEQDRDIDKQIFRNTTLQLPEYPGVTFRNTGYSVTAVENGVETELITGMPVWNIYLCDLTGDGRRDLCATVSYGSGMVDDHIVVYDHAAHALYTLWDRGTYDYVLKLVDGALWAECYPYMVHRTGESLLSEGPLVLLPGDGETGSRLGILPAQE